MGKRISSAFRFILMKRHHIFMHLLFLLGYVLKVAVNVWCGLQNSERINMSMVQYSRKCIPHSMKKLVANTVWRGGTA
jgi:Plasmid recombination enzyme.